ncbi:MAG: aminotransferase class IV [Geodermatophilaceae bacterium]
MDNRRVAVLDRGVVTLVDPRSPVFSAFDLGPSRGDGVFETLLVRAGAALKADAHLDRLARSAALMGLPSPRRSEWSRLVAVLTDGHEGGEAALKLLLTRGVEGVSDHTAVGTLSPLSPEVLQQRRRGISVVTLALGLPADLRAASPWLLGGVKYLSYAVNMAAQRHAKALGADDALFVALDGQLLEGPTSTVVWARDGILHTPPVETGILPGTTQALLFDRAGTTGLGTAVSAGTIADLQQADAVWLVSSVRGAAAVTSLDGVPRGDAGLTPTVQELTGIIA